MSLFFNDFFDTPSFHVIPFRNNSNDKNKNNNGNNNNSSIVSRKQASQMHVDFIENPENYELHADLPGYAKDNINVHVDNGVLTLEATRDETKSSEEGNYYHKERSWGKVYRSFRLPVDANKDTAETKYVDGVLSITFPKVANAGAKKLTIS